MSGDRAAVHLDERLADCQPQAQTAKSPGDREFRLLEGIENAGQRFRLDSDPAVVHLNDHMRPVQPTANADAPAVRRKLDRILQ